MRPGRITNGIPVAYAARAYSQPFLELETRHIAAAKVDQRAQSMVLGIGGSGQAVGPHQAP